MCLVTLSGLNLPLSSSSTTSRELLSQFSTCSKRRWLDVGEKLKKITMYILVNQFRGNFHSKTLSFRKIKSVFRDVKWCFNASRGLKGLMINAGFDRGNVTCQLIDVASPSYWLYQGDLGFFFITHISYRHVLVFMLTMPHYLWWGHYFLPLLSLFLLKGIHFSNWFFFTFFFVVLDWSLLSTFIGLWSTSTYYVS